MAANFTAQEIDNRLFGVRPQTATESHSQMLAAPFALFAPPRELQIPVEGVGLSGLHDTWGQARAQGRHHEGIDIMAPMGTPIRATEAGRIVKFFESGRGGITIYQASANGRYIFYYAHLRNRAFGLTEGQAVAQGQVLGYVGQTGNATTPHLHFEIQRMGPDGQWWTAKAVNPYPYLLSGETPR